MDHFSGEKISIIGPSSSGKSTLAATMCQALNLPLLHLDQIAHKPWSKWERKPDDDLIAEQDEFLGNNNKWVIEGNYSVCMTPRLRAADTVIWCDPPLAGCIWRYLARCIESDLGRIGGLEGARGEFNIGLIKYTLQNYPQNKKKYEALIIKNTHLNIIHLKSFSDIKKFGSRFGKNI